MTMDWKTFAIDEKAVQEDGYTWEEMFYKQLRVPGLVLAMIAGGIYLFQPPAWWIAAGVFFVVFSAWPAYSSYTYMQRGERDHA